MDDISPKDKRQAEAILEGLPGQPSDINPAACAQILALGAMHTNYLLAAIFVELRNQNQFRIVKGSIQ